MSPRFKPWWWVLLAIPIAIGLAQIRFDVEVLDLLPPDEPAVQGLKLYQQHFANARELIITLRQKDADKVEGFARDLAERLRQETNLVTSVSWQPPWMEQPAQVAELAAYLWFNQPPDVFGALTNRLQEKNLPAVLAETKEALTTSLSPLDIARRAFDPFDLLSVPGLNQVGGMSPDQGQKMFGSADGTFRLVFVQARPELTSYRDCANWLSRVRAVVAELKRRQPDSGDVVIRYTGRPAFVTEIAGGMQHDLTGSILGTAAIIATLFWLTHRRWLPMFWLLTLLSLILLSTLGLGGLLLGTISVVSMGFAAVLLGLAVDYAVVHYQEALAQPKLTVPEIRREIAPSIFWAAITTISAFLVLNLGGLPGLAQLGSLVAIGVAVAALFMVAAFLPPLFPERRTPPPGFRRPNWVAYLVPAKEGPGARAGRFNKPYSLLALLVTASLLAAAGGVLAFKRPGLDRSADALRPQHAEAQEALDEITSAVGIPQNPLWLIASGPTEPATYESLLRAQAQLNLAMTNGLVSGYLLPVALWPREEYERANRQTALFLAAQAPVLNQSALAAGFNTNALFLTDELIATWRRAGASTGVFWPTNTMSQWLLRRFVAGGPTNWLVLGLVYRATNQVDNVALANLSRSLASSHIWLSGWDLLGTTTLERVRHRLWVVVLPMVALVLLSLWLAFRRLGEMLLGLGVLALSGFCLLTTMTLAGWSWNLLNLMALPLLLGTGVDYGIFMQLALRRYGGDVSLAQRSIGRALALCGGTAIAGFGSLAWSGNAGMASLGKICATGIAANMLISVFLLPAWWSALPANRPSQPGTATGSDTSSAPTAPSTFYQVWVWRLGLAIGKYLPRVLLEWLCVAVAELYYQLHPQRRQVVIQNLLPALNGDLHAARKTAHKLFRQFGLKMADLWRYESGGEVETRITEAGWENAEAARQRTAGMLLLTPHLGNWELGAPLLVKRGLPFLVITQPEPGQGLTEVRVASRARRGVETLVLGTDAFAFVEVIKRLQQGAAVALLIDRPPPPSGVTVELFGRPFRASIAAAELARASGCTLIGATLLRTADGYIAQILPEIHYDRHALGTREGRLELTQQILRAFEPSIRQNLDQWFHFVPIWPKS